MSRLAGPVPEPVRGHLEHVLEQALEGGAPEPTFVVAAASDLDWFDRAAAMSRSERARSVAAVDDEAALLSVLRLGFGGALWMPPATAAMAAALEAAAVPFPCHEVSFDAAVVSALTEAEETLAVAWRNRVFWQKQLGDEQLCELLAELAKRLEVQLTVLPWPALVVGGRSRREIEVAVEGLLEDHPAAPSQGVDTVPLSPGPMASLLSALVEHERAAGSRLAVSPRPVHSLPRGELVGWWSPSPPATLPETGWLATPVAAHDSGHRWQLSTAAGETSEVVDVVSTAALAEVNSPAIRVPGWAVRQLRSGSPAALFVGLIGRAASRRGLPLWVPNACHLCVRHLLRLGLDLWVDGPGVPCPDPE